MARILRRRYSTRPTMTTPAASRVHTAVFLGISLDGCIAGPQGDLSWLSACATESPADTGYEALMQRTDTLLLGRRTHDAVLALGDWPFRNHRVRVLTHRPLPSDHGAQACQGSLPEVLAGLHAEGSRHVYLDGGEVVAQALDSGLVDELTLSWIPVVLGSGTRLFSGPLPRSDWRLVQVRTFASGMVQARYERR